MLCAYPAPEMLLRIRREYVRWCFRCAGLYARVPLLARAQDQRQRACKALAAARASGAEGSQKVRHSLLLHQ